MRKIKDKIFSGLLIMMLFSIVCHDLKAVDKTQPDKKAVAESIKQNGKWYVFSSKTSTRFKVMGKYDYDHAKEGILYKGMPVKGKFYLMSEAGAIYEPTWETKNNLKQFVVPASQYLKTLEDEQKKCKALLDTSSKKIKKTQRNVERLKAIWIDLSSEDINRASYKYQNSYTRRISDAQKKYKDEKKELDKLEKAHGKVNEKYQTADKKYREFYTRYSKSVPAAAMDKERRELTELIKDLPIEKVKDILNSLKAEKNIEN